MITYYVTGITGHLGRNIALELLKKQNVQIVGLVLPHEKIVSFNDNRVTFVKGNILNKEEIRAFYQTNRSSINYVIHAAGLISIYKKKDPLVVSVNVIGTKNVLNTAIECKMDKFIYISSVDALKWEKNKIISEPSSFNKKDVIGVYAKSKAEASEYVLSKKDNIWVSIVIPSALVGPDDYLKGPLNYVLYRYLKGKLKAIVKGGYDLVDVRDVAYGAVNSFNIDESGHSYILSGEKISISSLVKVCNQITNSCSSRFILPTWLVKIFAPLLELIYKSKGKKPLFTAHSMTILKANPTYSSNKAKELLGYKSRPLIETLKDTFMWIDEHLEVYQ